MNFSLSFIGTFPLDAHYFTPIANVGMKTFDTKMPLTNIIKIMYGSYFRLKIEMIILITYM